MTPLQPACIGPLHRSSLFELRERERERGSARATAPANQQECVQKRVAGEKIGSRVLQSENLSCNVLLAEFTALPSVPKTGIAVSWHDCINTFTVHITLYCAYGKSYHGKLSTVLDREPIVRVP